METTTEFNDNQIENNLDQEIFVEVKPSHEVTLYAEPIYHISSFPVTNALFTSWIAVFLIIIIVIFLRRKLQQIPKGIQNFFEIILDGALLLCDQVTGNRKISNKVFPLAFSVFLFVLINNWLGILPLGGLGLVERGGRESVFIPFIRSGTADINTTLTLALIAVVSANIFGIISVGIWKAFNKYVNIRALGQMVTKVRQDPTILVVSPVTFFVGILEFVGEFAKVASLSFRLFGNIFAGEVLLVSMSALLAYGLPIPFLFLEIFIGLIQAFIFAILMLVYFTIAAQDHDEHEPASTDASQSGEHEHEEKLAT